MTERSVILSLPYIQAAQAQKHVTHNEAIGLLDVIVQAVVIDADRTEPPASPAEADRHIVATGATGDWAGQDGAIAVRDSGAWLFTAPQTGWQVRDLGTGTTLVFDGSVWAADGAASSFDTVGINAAADASNRLAVSSPAVLLNHEGAGHQLKINKALDSDTASLLFQTGYSGRAEMGTAGSDDFAIKVSDDGSSFTTALSFDAASGLASGAAVYPEPTAGSDGTLMPTGSFGLGAAIVRYDGADDYDAIDATQFLGNMSVASVPANAPSMDDSFSGFSIHTSSTRTSQLFFRNNGANMYFRTKSGTWGPWYEMLHGGNLVGTLTTPDPAVDGAAFDPGGSAGSRSLKFADGTMIVWREAEIDVTSTAVQSVPFPADFAERPSVSVAHLTATPNAALEMGNIRAVAPNLVGQSWDLTLKVAGTSSAPTSDDEKLVLTAVGRWG